MIENVTVSASQYPSFPGGKLPENGGKKRKEKERKANQNWRQMAQPSVEIMEEKNEQLERSLKVVYEHGFNIYALINRWKKQAIKKKYRNVRIPDEVLIEICNQYLRYQRTIFNQWGWFVTVLKSECEKFNARQVVVEHESYKRPGGMSLADILKQAGDQN